MEFWQLLAKKSFINITRLFEKNCANFLPLVKIRKAFQIWLLKISRDLYNRGIDVILPLFCDISGIDAHKIISTTFFIVVDELNGGCETLFSRCMLFFCKTKEVFRIRTCGPYSEHPKCKKKWGETIKQEITSQLICP